MCLSLLLNIQWIDGFIYVNSLDIIFSAMVGGALLGNGGTALIYKMLTAYYIHLMGSGA